MRPLAAMTAILASLALAGCAEYQPATFDRRADLSTQDIPAASIIARPHGPRAPAAPADANAPPGNPPGQPGPVAPLDVRAAELAQQRMVIYTADYELAVPSPAAAMNDVAKLATELGGYLQSRQGKVIVIRVPADKFGAATARLDKLGKLLKDPSIQAVEVTEQFTDLKTRLAANQTMLKRLQALLDKADDVRRAMEVEKEIQRVVLEIERLEGQIRLLENRVALSTLTVSITQLALAPRSSLLDRKLPFNWLRTLGVAPLLDY